MGHPNESLFLDQNKNPFHDMDHTAIAGTTLVGGASLAIGGPVLLRGRSGNDSGATKIKEDERKEHNMKVKEKEEKATKEEQARKVKEKEEKARNMQYYYWRQYGNNAICLFKTTKKDYDTNHKNYGWNGKVRTYDNAKYWYNESNTYKTKTFRHPYLTYCLDTYWYGYFQTTKIDSSGQWNGMVDDLPESLAP